RDARRARALGARTAGGTVQLRGLERWISGLRLVVIPFVVVIVALAGFPAGAWGLWAWGTTGIFVAGSVALYVLARSPFADRHPFRQSVGAQVFDTAIVTGYVMAFAFERGLPVQQILYLDLAAACVRFAIPGGLILAAVSAPIVAVFEKLRADFLALPYSWKLVVFQTGIEVMMALIV